MSEYQYYKFERLDGYLDAKARQALRAISSRAEISATAFQVYYTYSDLKAEPFELMLKYFDIGFFFFVRNWELGVRNWEFSEGGKGNLF